MNSNISIEHQNANLDSHSYLSYRCEIASSSNVLTIPNIITIPNNDSIILEKIETDSNIDTIDFYEFDFYKHSINKNCIPHQIKKIIAPILHPDFLPDTVRYFELYSYPDNNFIHEDCLNIINPSLIGLIIHANMFDIFPSLKIPRTLKILCIRDLNFNSSMINILKSITKSNPDLKIYFHISCLDDINSAQIDLISDMSFYVYAKNNDHLNLQIYNKYFMIPIDPIPEILSDSHEKYDYWYKLTPKKIHGKTTVYSYVCGTTNYIVPPESESVRVVDLTPTSTNTNTVSCDSTNDTDDTESVNVNNPTNNDDTDSANVIDSTDIEAETSDELNEIQNQIAKLTELISLFNLKH